MSQRKPMNGCQFLDEFLDGSLQPNQAALFNEHLNSCADCRLELEIAHGLDQNIRDGWATVVAPKYVHHAITVDAKKRGTVPAQYSAFTMRRMVAAALALAASILLVVGAATWFDGAHNDATELVNNRDNNAFENNLIENIVNEVSKTDFVNPVVAASKFDNGAATILVPERRISPNFTIVKAYPAINLKKANNLQFEGKK